MPLEISSFQKWLSNISTVVVSPGISWDHQALKELRSKGIQVKGEIGIAWERLKDIPWIGITGTNGKTTVSKMLHHVLEENQIIVPIGGNTGIAATKIALDIKMNRHQETLLFIMS